MTMGTRKRERMQEYEIRRVMHTPTHEGVDALGRELFAARRALWDALNALHLEHNKLLQLRGRAGPCICGWCERLKKRAARHAY